MTVAGVSGSVYPSVDGVGVLESSVVTEAGTDVGWAGFLAIFDLVSRPGNAGAVATTTCFGGGLILDRVTRCGGGVPAISLSSSSSSSSSRVVVDGTAVIS